MPLVNVARLLAVAWMLLSAWVFLLMLNGFSNRGRGATSRRLLN